MKLKEQSTPLNGSDAKTIIKLKTLYFYTYYIYTSKYSEQITS